MLTRSFSAGLIAILLATPVWAQRRPVLQQIDLPHPYYFREMYLPQLTSGPSSVAWSPDSNEVVFSMAGSLWRQKIDSNDARQLTDGPGYDYQPDWSPDGKNIVYVSYQKDAMELWLLDLRSGKTMQLTNSGAVNVEPRWSPDGKRLVFVSTEYHKRFHIFRADLVAGKLENSVRLTGENKSSLPRYYYSAFDVEISPVWTRDGQEILFISNRGHIHGTGGFWRMKAEPGAEAREIHYEETNWKARPDFSPDGSRMVYSSYLGRQWHQLWVMPANGGDAFPISYAAEDQRKHKFISSDDLGGWDETAVRWAPSGKRLAFVSNRDGNTSLWLQDVPGGLQNELTSEERHYLHPQSRLRISVKAEGRGPQMARISVTDASGRFWAPKSALIHGDDGFDRGKTPFEAHYYHDTRESSSEDMYIDVPPGEIVVEVLRGFEDRPEHTKITLTSGESRELELELKPLEWKKQTAGHWVSNDLHVHMNYGGTYVNYPQRLRDEMEAEGLQIANNLIVNKEQRFPDVSYRGSEVEGDADALLVTGQEFHTSYWGHRGLLNLKDHLLLPGYAGYPNTAASSLYPMNADVYDMAHAQGALVGAVHPFDEVPDPFANPPQRITDELPLDVALGKVDYMEIVGFSDHRSTASVWYRLLNLGFRIPAGAGTDAMTDYASLRGPVGLNRVYAWVPGWPLNIQLWFEALKKGHTFATNGPLLEFTLGGQRVGDELTFEKPQEAVAFTVKLRSIVPVDHLEIVCNGRILQTLKLEGARDSTSVNGTLPLKESGWCVLRASSDQAEYPVLDNYVYATTSPVYVTIGGKPPHSPEDAKYFIAWIARVMDATSHYPDWNSAAEKEYVMRKLEEGESVFEKLK